MDQFDQKILKEILKLIQLKKELKNLVDHELEKLNQKYSAEIGKLEEHISKHTKRESQ